MLFSSVIFLFYFLPAVIFGYFLTPKKWRNWWLILTSLFFYAWGEGVYMVFLLASVVLTHISVRQILRHADSGGGKRWLIIGIVLNLLILGVNKYGVFVVETVNTILSFVSTYQFGVPDIKLPLGISFFVFQSISYIVDAYRKELTIRPTFKESLLYIALFPQLVAGPIVRFTDIQSALRARVTRFDDVVEGTKRFIRGLAKKVLIANQVALVADSIFALSANELTMTLAWIGIIMYSLQIFFDFSGYTDMAIGLGRIFGFTFPENFNYPYIAKSVQEFWRRWHMSLSTWIRDYVYIPLGGSRRGVVRTYVNLFVVFTLVGLWHGAGWTFILWGMWYGMFMVLERWKLGALLERIPALVSHSYLIVVTLIGWTLFRADTLAGASTYMQALFGFGSATRVLDLQLFVTAPALIATAFGVLCVVPIGPWLAARPLVRYIEPLVLVVYLMLLILSILHIGIGTYNPFIYFRF